MHETGRSGLVHWDDPWGMGWGGRWEESQDRDHMYTHGWFMWNVWQNPPQYYKVISLQLKEKKRLSVCGLLFLPWGDSFHKGKSSGVILLVIPYWKDFIWMILKFLTCIFFFPGFIPVCSLGVAQVGRLNFGKDVSTLKYFTICGLQEGYEPFAVNTNRDITMWLSKRLPQFLQVPSNHEHIEVCFFFLNLDHRPKPGVGVPT